MPPPSSSSSSHHLPPPHPNDAVVERAIEAGIAAHAELPPRIRASLPASEWRSRAKSYLVRKGVAWGATPAARGCCSEKEYYESLVSFYLEAKRVYPYHLSHYVSRSLRVTPPLYYAMMLNSTLRSGRPYSSLPNFSAADAARTLGVGRNEFISAANATSASDSATLSSPTSAGSVVADDLEAAAKKVAAAASRRGRAAIESLFSAGNPSSSTAGPSVSSPAPARVPPPSSCFSSTPPGLPSTCRGFWRAHAVNVGEKEASSLSEKELSVARLAAAPGGVALSDVGLDEREERAAELAALTSLYKKGIVYLSVPISPDEDAISVPPLEGFVSNRGGAGVRGARRESGGGGGGGGESSGSDDDDGGERRRRGGRADERASPSSLDLDEDPVEPLLYAILVAAGGDNGDGEGSDDDDGDENDDGGEREKKSDSPPRPKRKTPAMTVRRLSEEILGLDLGAALAAASLAVRLGFAKRRERRRPTTKGEGEEEEAKATPRKEQRPRPSIALLVDAAVTSSLMAGALSPGLKTHAVSLFEGGRVAGSGVVVDGERGSDGEGNGPAVGSLLRELDATTEAAERFGAEGGIAELAADAGALAAVIRALRESGKSKKKREKGDDGRLGDDDGRLDSLPRIELFRKEALEAALPPEAAARLLTSEFDAVVAVCPSAPLSLSVPTTPSPPSASSGPPPPLLLLGPCPLTCSPPWSQLLLWELCRSGPPPVPASRVGGSGREGSLASIPPTDAAFAIALPSGLELRRLPRALRGAKAVALWCWRGGPGGPALDLGAGEGGRRQPRFFSPPSPSSTAPRGLPASEALLGAGIARAPFVFRSLQDALASRGSAGGGVLAVPLPAGVEAEASSSASAAPSLETNTAALSVADVALPLGPDSSGTLYAVDPVTGETTSIGAPGGWGEAAEAMALRRRVGFVRFARFGGGTWFPLGVRLGVPLSPRATCDAVCRALSSSDLLTSEGIEGAREGRKEEDAVLLASSLSRRALAFDGKEMRDAVSVDGGGGEKASLGSRALQASAVVV